MLAYLQDPIHASAQEDEEMTQGGAIRAAEEDLVERLVKKKENAYLLDFRERYGCEPPPADLELLRESWHQETVTNPGNTLGPIN